MKVVVKSAGLSDDSATKPLPTHGSRAASPLNVFPYEVPDQVLVYRFNTKVIHVRCLFYLLTFFTLQIIILKNYQISLGSIQDKN